MDGAFFGTTFPHLLFQTYRELNPSPIAPVGTNMSSLNTQTPPQRPTNGTGQDSSSEPVGGVAGEEEAQSVETTGVAEVQQGSSSIGPTSAAPLTVSTLQASLLGQRTPQARLYTPRIYGFRVSEQAKSGPRMRWMRMRPESFEELDQGLATKGAVVAVASTAALTSAMGKGPSGEGLDGQDVVMLQQSHHGITPDGRSTATGRPIAGRATSASTPAA